MTTSGTRRGAAPWTPGTSALMPSVSSPMDQVSLFAFRAGWRMVRRMPRHTAYLVFENVAHTTYLRNGSSVRRLRANYAKVRPELSSIRLEALVRRGVASYLRYWCDAFIMPELSTKELVRQVRVIGDGPPRAELAADRGFACFLGHLGNWDTAGAWSTTQMRPVTTVAERLKPEELYREFLSYRERLGMTIHPLTGAGESLPKLVEALRAGAIVPLLADRDLTRRGVEVDFCGHRARMAAGPALLAIETGRALFPISTYYERDFSLPSGYGLVIHFHDPVPVPAVGTVPEQVTVMTQACADALATTVLEHTEDWHMMQRVFVADLDPRRS